MPQSDAVEVGEDLRERVGSSDEDMFDDSEDESSVDEVDVDKSEGEMEAIGWEMQQLEDSVPQLRDKYRLIDRLGEGTTSLAQRACMSI